VIAAADELARGAPDTAVVGVALATADAVVLGAELGAFEAPPPEHAPRATVAVRASAPSRLGLVIVTR